MSRRGVHTKYCLYSEVVAVKVLGVYSEQAQYQESSMPAWDPDTTRRCRVVSECSHAMNDCNATGRLRVQGLHTLSHPPSDPLPWISGRQLVGFLSILI